jgi:toxin YoeB
LAQHPGDSLPPIHSRNARIDPKGNERAAREIFDRTRLVSWKIVFTKQAQRDAKKIARSGLRQRTEVLLTLVAHNPFQIPPPCEKLVGDLAGAYSRRINIQHRLVYQVYPKERTIKVLRMWTHYE